MKYILLVLLLASCSSKDHYKHYSEDCRDFLKEWQAAHDKIKFASCKKEDTSTDQPKLIATYKVDGRDAKDVEKYLGDKFGMMPLEFVCCGYSPKSVEKNRIPLPNQGKGMFKDSDYREYFTIEMRSNETVKKDWEVLNFIVEVETYYKGI